MAMKSYKKKFSFRKLFRGRDKKASWENEDSLHSSVAECEESTSLSVPPTPLFSQSFSEGREMRRINFSEVSSMVSNDLENQPFKVFVATWNVGGKPPHTGVNLNDFLPADDLPDMYILGFQETVPLNAGNVLVTEDSEPAVKWLELINAALNKPLDTERYSHKCTLKYSKSSPDSFGTRPITGRDAKNNATLFFQKPSLKEFSKRFKIENARRLKTCNCPVEVPRKYWKETCFICPQSSLTVDDTSDEEEEEPCRSTVTDEFSAITPVNQLNYSLITCKQKVGIFVTIWVKREHVQHIGHLRLSTVNCGILGYLGNKGCVSVSMSLHQTSFCFVCSHLAAGQKEGDELKRNSDVIEILKSTQLRRICKVPNRRRIPEKILEHDRVIWLGDLNYRIALSYTETKRLLDENHWDALLEKDQLKIEREAGRVFKGWNEGKIYFAPTYKYSDNSDAYAGESVTSEKKRRTPAWCDRILWHGNGIVQLSYIRGESRFSDHRPVCAAFIVDVGVSSSRKDTSSRNMKVGAEELLPPDSRGLSLT